MCVPHAFDLAENGVPTRGSKGYVRKLIAFTFVENPENMSTPEMCDAIVQNYINGLINCAIYTNDTCPDFFMDVHYKIVNNWMSILAYKGIEMLYSYDKSLKAKYASMKDMLKISKNNLDSVFSPGMIPMRTVTNLMLGKEKFLLPVDMKRVLVYREEKAAREQESLDKDIITIQDSTSSESPQVHSGADSTSSSKRASGSDVSSPAVSALTSSTAGSPLLQISDFKRLLQAECWHHSRICQGR
jgi:hypothetical protein